MATEATTQLGRTAERVSELARPRASVGVVALVVLAGELIALSLAVGATTFGEARVGSLLVTVAVLGAAAAAIGQVARFRGHATEPGHRWLLTTWIVVAALASGGLGQLPLGLTQDASSITGIDAALASVLAWTLALAVGVLGADARPEAGRLPYVLVGAIGLVGLVATAVVGDGDMITSRGPTTLHVLLAALVLAVSLVAVVRWLFRWKKRGGWALTWSGTALVLSTAAVVLQMAAEFGNDRIWVASTGLLVSSLIVPGLGALAAGGAIAGAHTIARRQLRTQLDAVADGTEGDAALPILDALDVTLLPVARVANRTVIGSLARAGVPGDAIGGDWWRGQAAKLGLAEELEVALAMRALDAVAREDAANWVVVPIAAEAVGAKLVAALASRPSGTLVVVLRGTAKQVDRAVPLLRAAEITCGIWTSSMDVRLLEAADGNDVSLLVVDRRLVQGADTDRTRRDALRAIVRHADAHSLAVLVEGVEEAPQLWMLEELGVRYLAGPVLDTVAGTAATPAPGADVVGLIEAAGLRESPGPDRT